jgi:hypothetical protein
VFFFMLSMFGPMILMSSAWAQSWSVPFNFSPAWFSWTLLMVYSKTKLKNSGVKMYPCFRHSE